MSYRRYVVEVERVQRQQVTFVADPADNDMLTRIAAAHCHDDCWTETEYRFSRTSTTSDVRLPGKQDQVK